MKKTLFIITLLFLLLSGVFVFITPKMHKNFQFSLIEKIIKINPDKSSTTIIKTTNYKGAE